MESGRELLKVDGVSKAFPGILANDTITFDLKEGGKVTLKLEFAADKKVSITVKGEKQSDIHLFVYDAAKKEVAKDDSPGPDCLVTFTPKADGKLTVVVHNKGPGANRAAVKVAFPKD